MEEQLKKKVRNLEIVRLILIILIGIEIGVGIGFPIIMSIEERGSCSELMYNERDAFNQKFIELAGENVAGANVKTLIREVYTRNKQNQGYEDRTILITVDGRQINKVGDTSEEELIFVANAIFSSHRYNVELEYNQLGLVHVINIRDNKNNEVNNLEK